MVKVLDSGVQPQKFLRSSFPLETKLVSLLTLCGAMRLLNQVVAACTTDHLLVGDIDQARDPLNRSSVTPKLIRGDRFWDIVFTEQPSQEGSRRLGITMPLKEEIEHEAVLVHGPPQPMSDAIHRCADLVQKPAGTPASPPADEGPQRTEGRM